MTTILQYGTDMYRYIFQESPDPRSKSFMLIDSPILMASLLISYYYFVYYGGRLMMENRKPFNLNSTMIVYNAVQSILNIYVFVKGLHLLITFEAPISCIHVTKTTTHHDMEVLRMVHFYFMLKVSDLTDTVFMVLRKNYHQITFLHVYHHIGMVIATWAVTKYLPGGHIAFVGIVNALVHSVMYLYYLICAKYPEYKSSIWWKKNITQIQLIQFLILMVHHATALFNSTCSYPKIPLAIFLSQAILMFVLFSKFYYINYINPIAKIATSNGVSRKKNL